MMEKVLTDQRGRNVEIYLVEIVIKSKSELDLVQDVEETLSKLKRVNIKIDSVMSSFEVKEERFLGHMVTKEGNARTSVVLLEEGHGVLNKNGDRQLNASDVIVFYDDMITRLSDSDDNGCAEGGCTLPYEMYWHEHEAEFRATGGLVDMYLSILDDEMCPDTREQTLNICKLLLETFTTSMYIFNLKHDTHMILADVVIGIEKFATHTERHFRHRESYDWRICTSSWVVFIMIRHSLFTSIICLF
ncbi:hypothetical protein Tco_0420891 [Tanacetum coccineum]